MALIAPHSLLRPGPMLAIIRMRHDVACDSSVLRFRDIPPEVGHDDLGIPGGHDLVVLHVAAGAHRSSGNWGIEKGVFLFITYCYFNDVYIFLD